jgi:hypothetical protein
MLEAKKERETMHKWQKSAVYTVSQDKRGGGVVYHIRRSVTRISALKVKIHHAWPPPWRRRHTCLLRARKRGITQAKRWNNRMWSCGGVGCGLKTSCPATFTITPWFWRYIGLGNCGGDGFKAPRFRLLVGHGLFMQRTL